MMVYSWLQNHQSIDQKLKARLRSRGAHHKICHNLDSEQAVPLRDGIIISYADKLHQYILQMYALSFFDRTMMTEWEKKATTDKIYANALTFFNNKMTSIDTYQENSGNSAKKNSFEGANAAVEIADKIKEIL